MASAKYSLFEYLDSRGLGPTKRYPMPKRHYITLHLRYITLHYITLHYVTFHYITFS